MSDILKVFFKDVGKSSLLTREEEVLLSQRIEQGDDDARCQMISANIRLAISIAKKYQNRGCSLEDLIQEANIGLMKAVDRFDWRRGFKFSTYGCWWIKQSVRRHLAAQSSTIRLPSHAKGLLWRARQLTKEYEEEFGGQPTLDEIAELLGVTTKSLRAIMESAQVPISLDQPSSRGGEGRLLGELIPDTDAQHPAVQLDHTKIVEAVRAALGDLTDREEKIIRLRFGISEDPADHENFPITFSKLETIKRREVAHEYAKRI